ncbi:MAG: ATP-binding cassette domain-containing protein [Cyclobacteriaceae bacterium]
MIRLQNLHHSFATTTIDYPDWEIEDGGQALILGNSGSGKTTLLHLVTGLLQPTKGIIELNGFDLAKMTSSKLDKFRGKNIGVVFQKPHLIRSISVAQNIRLPGHFIGKKITTARLNAVASSLGISELLGRKAHELSEGQAQRVSIARAVIHEPSLLAADEPTASLDDENCDRVIKLLQTQAQRCSATLLIATHDHRVKDKFKNRLEL